VHMLQQNRAVAPLVGTAVATLGRAVEAAAKQKKKPQQASPLLGHPLCGRYVL